MRLRTPVTELLGVVIPAFGKGNCQARFWICHADLPAAPLIAEGTHRASIAHPVEVPAAYQTRLLAIGLDNVWQILFTEEAIAQFGNGACAGDENLLHSCDVLMPVELRVHFIFR